MRGTGGTFARGTTIAHIIGARRIIPGIRFIAGIAGRACFSIARLTAVGRATASTRPPTAPRTFAGARAALTAVTATIGACGFSTGGTFALTGTAAVARLPLATACVTYIRYTARSAVAAGFRRVGRSSFVRTIVLYARIFQIIFTTARIPGIRFDTRMTIGARFGIRVTLWRSTAITRFPIAPRTFIITFSHLRTYAIARLATGRTRRTF